MRIHYIQHVPFETPANIFKWVNKKGHKITGTHLYKDEKLPDLSSFDFLIIMGGPMGVYDEDKFSWLQNEKKFIYESIKAEKKVLGICLGAQLIADVLGSKVYKNKYKEIGWYKVFKTEDSEKCIFFSDFPESFTAFHWHGDTFEIPDGAVHTIRSEGCENQAFVYENRVIGLQFHLETDLQSANLLIENSQEELKEKGKFIMSKEEMLKDTSKFLEIENLLYKLLDKFED